MTHRLAGAEEIAAQGLVDVVGESLPQTVGPSHARDASLLERRVKKSPRRFAAQAPARVLLARE